MHSLGVPVLLYQASFQLSFLTYKIFKGSNFFFPLEWIFGSIAVRENMMKVTCGSILGQSPSMLVKRHFLGDTMCPGKQPYCTAFFFFLLLVAIA